MIIEENVYLEHFGKKGMRWGVRAAKSTGRGIKETAKFSRDHPKTTATVAAGAIVVAAILTKKGSTKTTSIKFDLDKMNKNIAEAYKSGLLWDKQGMGRGMGELGTFGPQLAKTKEAMKSIGTTEEAFAKALSEIRKM